MNVPPEWEAPVEEFKRTVTYSDVGRRVTVVFTDSRHIEDMHVIERLGFNPFVSPEQDKRARADAQALGDKWAMCDAAHAKYAKDLPARLDAHYKREALEIAAERVAHATLYSNGCEDLRGL